ncbi:MAG: HAD family hydrolase [Flavobacteriaceae bacterium]|nr:HAD family hydrolase [Flavobacteriaceae bacterium]
MIKNILFDFDGVILDSMPIREYGFRNIFKDFEDKLVEIFLEYHNKNAGLSRYVKIRYFYEKLLNQSISNNEVTKIAEKFSVMMRTELINKKYLIKETVEFLDRNHKKFKFHIVSGSDQNELRFLCKELDVEKYFISIYGSPIHKNDLVKNLLEKEKYNKNESILIGDSINDYNAAKINNIDFYGFNNAELKKVSKFYIKEYDNIFKEILND